MAPAAHERTVDMQAGLFLIKYESSESGSHPPSVRVAPEPGSESAIELILQPDVGEAVLWSPGASLVARAVRNGRIRIVVAATQPNGSVNARVQIAALSNDPAGAKERELAAPLNLSEFRILGHVAGRGDVTVNADHWVGGPAAPCRIEGIAIQWPNKPPDLNLRYAVTIGGPRPTLGQFVDAGAFAGTKGRALPLVGATLEISGPGAVGQHLSVESIFLGSPQMKVVGQRVVLAGPTGREPLVGLRIRIEPVDQAQPLRQVDQTPQVSTAKLDDQKQEVEPARRSGAVVEMREKPKSSTPHSAPKQAGRVRVFRSPARGKPAEAAR